MLFAWHCQMLVFFKGGRVYGVRADLRDRAEGGAGGALAPPLPHFFTRIKIN